MSYCWPDDDFNFHLQGNGQGSISRSGENNKKLNTKAYLNPQVVNYEFIKRSLSKNLQGRGKIHVNPNFRGSRLSNVTNNDSQSLINSVHLNPENKAINKPGTSEMSSVFGEECNSAFFDDKKRNLNSTKVIPYKNQFKKINKINVKSNKSLYSWSKNETDGTDSNSSHKSLITESPDKEINLQITNYKRSAFKYTSPKKAISEDKNNCLIYKSKTRIINKFKTKLINNASVKMKLHFTDKRICTPLKKPLNLSRFAYNKSKKPSLLMVAKAVRCKYKYLNNLEQYKNSNYKIDKRNKLCKAVKNKSDKIKDIRKLFPNYLYNKVKSSYNIYSLDKYNVLTESCQSWRKDQSSVKNIKKIVNHPPSRRVVNIGGILYKSTANTLTLANKEVKGGSKKTVLNKSKDKKNHVVYVRGEKFILENNGRALRRQSEANEKSPLLTPKRIDIGGVTYLQKSHNVLIRTNVHQARHFVNRAKNKSIALLANLHKRSSMPCMIYHRFGRCIRHSKGLCMYKHDPKNIALCKKFLKGNCANNNCLLSHQVIQEKMATCHFFLKGLCVRENCPFLHVKLNKNAAICEKFIQGFCNLGKECSKRHLHQCPEFDKFGTCKLGTKCHYPHKKIVKTNNSLEEKFKDIQNHGSAQSEDQCETVQYYVKTDIQKKQKRTKKSVAKLKEIGTEKSQRKATKKKALFFNSPVDSTDTIKCFPKRIMLDKLPCFIPLSSDS